MILDPQADRKLNEFLKQNQMISPQPHPYEEQKIAAILKAQATGNHRTIYWRRFIPIFVGALILFLAFIIERPRPSGAPGMGQQDVNTLLWQTADDSFEEEDAPEADGEVWFALLDETPD